PDDISTFCHVYYAPLNFCDIRLAMGILSPEPLPANLVGQERIMGIEFSGRDNAGKRIMAMVAAGSL
ncbi:hypothetical protein ILUMI_20425, partial [Ignelater luminosus]